MKINKNERTIYIDVDDTLILSTSNPKAEKLLRADVLDPLTHKYIKVAVHEPMVRLLKEEKHRGSHITVWSRGGYEWAANVIRGLDLVPFVDEVCSKPMVYFDDVEIASWLPYRVWLEPDCNYKK